MAELWGSFLRGRSGKAGQRQASLPLGRPRHERVVAAVSSPLCFRPDWQGLLPDAGLSPAGDRETGAEHGRHRPEPAESGAGGAAAWHWALPGVAAASPSSKTLGKLCLFPDSVKTLPALGNRTSRLRTELSPSLTPRAGTASPRPGKGGSSGAGCSTAGPGPRPATMLAWTSHIPAFCLIPFFVKWTPILHQGVVKPN